MSANDNDSLVNTKSGALTVIAICLIALVALSVYKYWLTETDRPRFVFEKEPYGVEYPIGFFIGGLGMTGILSFVWWAFRRFQWSRASGPLLLWSVLVFLFCVAHLSIM